ncbi:MAG: DUF5667 domain-containing protein [bacterium]
MTFKKISITLFAISFLLGAGLTLAQEESAASEELSLDETITAEDLGIEEPSLLPDNPFYFLKEMGRGIQSFFTFNQIKKLELKEKFSNEKIIELQKMVEQNANQERIKTALRNYQKELGDMQQIAAKIQERTQTEADEETGKFLDKFVQKQILHQRIIQRLENQVPEEAMEKIREIKEKQLENFGEVMTRLENANTERIQERLEKNLKEIEGSDFQGFKNLEVLGRLIEKVPEQAKNAIRNVQESTMNALKEKLETLSVQQREKFQEYIENSSGDKEKQLEILDSLKENIPAIKEMLLDSRERIIEQVRERVQTAECKEIEKPTSNFCANGRIVVDRDDDGCITDFECITLAETNSSQNTACTLLWAPVCGKNGKTYSNKCFANASGVNVAYEGICERVQEREQEREMEKNEDDNTLNMEQEREMEKAENNFFQKQLIEPIKGILNR